MDDRIDLTDQKLDPLLTGFARDLRDVYVTSPSEATQARHLAAIMELARSLDDDSASLSRRNPMLTSRPMVRAAKAAACAASLVFATAGLAVAGVQLPAPANEAFGKLGLSLPNQAGGGGGPSSTSERATEVHGVIDATAPGDRDCEFGHAVAAAARGSALPTQAQAACGHGEDGAARKNEAQARGRGHANAGGNSVGSSQSTAGRAFGEQTSQRSQGLGDAAPDQSDAASDQRRQFGEDTSVGAQELGSEPPAAPLAAPAPPAPEGGRETGQTQSDSGQATGDQASGGRQP
jgi:hypothetical protein